MVQIPLEQSNEDIYAMGFDKSLNRNPDDISTPVVYDSLDEKIDTGQITPGMLRLSGLQIGESQKGSNLAPFEIKVDDTGNINRVGAIKISSAGDLGVSTLNPEPTANKVIYADNTNDLRINSPTAASLVSIDTVGVKRLIVGGVKSSLTDASANSIFEVTLNADDYTGGQIRWTVVASDGTDYQSRTGITSYAVVDKATALTTDVDEIGGSVAVSTGTLTGTWGILDGANKITLQFTPTSSLTTTSLTLYWTLDNPTGHTITRI